MFDVRYEPPGRNRPVSARHMPRMHGKDRLGNGLSARRALQESRRLLEKAGAVLGTGADVGQGRRVVRLQISTLMSFNSRHGTLLVMALAGIAVCALLIVQTRTQKMEKQKSERNQATSRPPALPELRDPRLVIR